MTAARLLGVAVLAAPFLSGAAIGAWWAVRQLRCRLAHRWTRWHGSLIEDDERHTLLFIPDIQWRICRRCGHHQERGIKCVSS